MTNNTTAIAKLETIDPEKLKLIKSTIAKDCTDTELSLLLYQADRLNLDPLQKQIWAVKFADKPALIFVGRDGYLQFAHKSGQFDGMDTTIEGDGDNQTATTKVYRKDMSHPIVVSVKMKEYNKHHGNWNEMPETMLKKVSQSQALRQAFAISGVYSPEEMEDGKGGYRGQTIDVTPTERYVPPSDTLQTKEERQWILDAREADKKKKQAPITVGS
jgi:phage recombination protein Bet